MKFEGDVAVFEAVCLKEIRESLERYDRAHFDWSPFRTLVAVELEGTYPDTVVLVAYRYKPEYKPIAGDQRADFHIWESTFFMPFARSVTKCGARRESWRRSFGSSSPTGQY